MHRLSPTYLLTSSASAFACRRSMMTVKVIGYSRAVMYVLSGYDKTGLGTCLNLSTHSHRDLRTLLIPSMHAALRLHSIAETPSPRMFWASLANHFIR